MSGTMREVSIHKSAGGGVLSNHTTLLYLPSDAFGEYYDISQWWEFAAFVTRIRKSFYGIENRYRVSATVAIKQRTLYDY